MELRCNNCNEIIDGFTSSHYSNITTHYVYNKEKRTFEVVGKEFDMDYNVDIEYYCLKCGKVLSEEISEEIVDIL